ncbi:MAG: SAF domain-containing protein [Candidatus Promineifilaceae bacterium]|nr:SAF domain-containing protein [Candidatus Promineifilaceae bacterium]
MNRRTLAILFLVGGFLLMVVVLFLLQQAEAPPTDDVLDAGEEAAQQDAAPTATATPPALVEVVVSLQTVPRGWRMTEAELTTDLRRAELVPDNVITDTEQAIGMFARTDIFQGETLTGNALIEDPTQLAIEEYGPSSLIPEGFLAQAVPMGRLSSVAYGIDEGDIVDVLITFYISEIDEEFQTLLENAAIFPLAPQAEEGEAEGEPQLNLIVIDPFGRFETLPNGELAFITPSETQRPIRVAFVLQAAKVIQVGPWRPLAEVAVPTPTPTPDPETTPTPAAGEVPTPTPTPPDVLLLALTPQQQLVLKYAVEVAADIDFALRPPNDTQIYSIETVDLPSFLVRFGIDLPTDFEFTANPVLVTVTPPPQPGEEGGQ